MELNKKEYQKGFNAAYALRRYHGMSLVQKLTGAINKQDSSYSRGFMEGLIQAEKDLAKEQTNKRNKYYDDLQKLRIDQADKSRDIEH